MNLIKTEEVINEQIDYAKNIIHNPSKYNQIELNNAMEKFLIFQESMFKITFLKNDKLTGIDKENAISFLKNNLTNEIRKISAIVLNSYNDLIDNKKEELAVREKEEYELLLNSIFELDKI